MEEKTNEIGFDQTEYDIQTTNDFSYKKKPLLLEYQYVNAFNKIIKKGVRKSNRTGIDTIAIQHQYFEIIDIIKHFPILRGKKVFPKMALKELIWMLLGRNDIKWLNDHGVTYWDEWAKEDGTIGKSYGYQYRNFNGIDQLKELINMMKKDPLGRRHIINLWNVSDLNEMALPPCMYDFHFSCVPVETNLFGTEYNVELHAKVRSNDSFLGAPYDFMFCGWFIFLICEYLSMTTKDCNFRPYKIHYTADDYHIYVNHIEQMHKYIDNVNENKHNCIKTPTTIYMDRSYFTGKYDKNYNLTIDEFLKTLELKLSDKDFIQITQQFDNATSLLDKSELEYGKIQADIAV